MNDADIVARIADYLHEFVDYSHSDPRQPRVGPYGRACDTCRANAEKILWMVDAYRKVEVA